MSLGLLLLLFFFFLSHWSSSSSSFLFPFTLGLVWSSSSFFFSFFLSFSIQTIPTNFSIQTISKKKQKKKRNCWNEKKRNPNRSLLRYKKQKNEDSNIEVTNSNLKSNQTKNPKKKKSKRDLGMARQWNEEYCRQPCPTRHDRENDESVPLGWEGGRSAPLGWEGKVDEAEAKAEVAFVVKIESLRKSKRTRNTSIFLMREREFLHWNSRLLLLLLLVEEDEVGLGFGCLRRPRKGLISWVRVCVLGE